MSSVPRVADIDLPASDVERPAIEAVVRSPVMACLEAVYGAEFGRGVVAEIEPLLMIRPPRGDCTFMTRKASLQHRNAPVRFTPMTWFHFSTRSSSMGPRRASGRRY